MHIIYKIKFLLHKRRSDDRERLAVRMRVTIHGKRPMDFPTGHHADVANWNAASGRAMIGTPDADAINRLCDEWTTITNDIFARYELVEKRVPECGEFRDLFNDTIGRPTAITRSMDDAHPDFYTAFDRFVSEQGMQNQWTDGTFEKFHAVRAHLYSFDNLLNWETLSERKLQSYTEHLLDGGMVNTTLAKHLAFVRWFLRWANQRGYYAGRLHETFKPKLKGTNGDCSEIIYLTKDELDTIRNHVFPPNEPGLERCRDVFVFCCFTGLRYSDVAKLRRSDIQPDAFTTTTKKTRDTLHIELNRTSRAILDKYANETFPDGKALPVISNTKMNAYLKRIGIECGLETPTRIVYFQGNRRIEQVMPKWQLLTTHVARRTFVVMALRLGIPAEVIMKWTGHSDFKSMKPYIAIVDELKRNAMHKFDDL